MILIGKPRLVDVGDNHVRLFSEITVDNEKCTIWAEVDNKYADYVCYERSDAFVIGLLHYAMVHNHDIACDAPMGEYLYYQITTYLIDAISKGSPLMHPIRILSEIDERKLPCAGYVGTGISCGIDSLHVLACQSDTKMKRHNITHLAFNNVGSHGEGARAIGLYNARKEMSERFCREYGYELTEVNSNIMDVFPQNHFLTHTFTSMFAVYVLQKLYGIYYYASGRQFSQFSLQNTSLDCSYYDLLLAEAFSSDHLKIYSEGGTLSRLEKTRQVVKYSPSYNYLNVCTSTSQNCGCCEKCTRTLLTLDVLGKLDAYKAVFDIAYYKQHKTKYLKTLLAQTFSGNSTYKELYPYLKNQFSLIIYMRAIPLIFKTYLKYKLPQGILRTKLKQAYHYLINN